jgi:hypothetical protein
MTEITFLYQALSDLLIGVLVIAPLEYIIEFSIPQSVRFSILILFGLLRYINLPDLVILLVFGLLWMLFIVLSGNTRIGWIW